MVHVKKQTYIALILFLSLLTTACGKETSQQEVSAPYIYKKTLEQIKEAKSFSMATTMSSKITPSDSESSTNTELKVEGVYTLEPLALHQTVLESTGEVNTKPSYTEMYITPQASFSNNGVSSVWVEVLPETKNKLLQEMPTFHISTLEHLQPFSDQFSFTESETHYSLLLTSNGEKVKDYIIKNMSKSFPQVRLENPITQLEVKEFTFTYLIDKTTFLPTEVHSHIRFQFMNEHNKQTLDFQMDGTMTNYNGMKEIKIPRDVLGRTTPST